MFTLPYHTLGYVFNSTLGPSTFW